MSLTPFPEDAHIWITRIVQNEGDSLQWYTLKFYFDKSWSVKLSTYESDSVVSINLMRY